MTDDLEARLNAAKDNARDILGRARVVPPHRVLSHHGEQIALQTMADLLAFLEMFEGAAKDLGEVVLEQQRRTEENMGILPKHKEQE